jgi:hypothetical protein
MAETVPFLLGLPVMVGEGPPSTTLLITARKDMDGRPSPTMTA